MLALLLQADPKGTLAVAPIELVVLLAVGIVIGYALGTWERIALIGKKPKKRTQRRKV